MQQRRQLHGRRDRQPRGRQRRRLRAGGLRRARRPLVALVALVVALLVGYGWRAAHSSNTPSPSARPRVSASASTPPSGSSGPRTAGVPLSSLPPQAATTVRLIETGGPFPYPENDGVVFHNYEGTLPAEPPGFYREYTVPTPGSADRGARRLVVGADGRYWYTDDHYETFEPVDLSR